MVKKLNNKGYMLVEIIVAAVIAFSVAYYLLGLVYKFKDVNEDLYESTIFKNLKVNLTKNIYNDMKEKGVYLISYNSTGEEKYADFLVEGERKRLIIKGNNLEYGKINKDTNLIDTSDSTYYQKTIPDYMEIKEIKIEHKNNILSIKIPISSIYNSHNESSDINLIFRCKKLNQVITEEGFDFSAIGTYGFAVAGANNAHHGDHYDDYNIDASWIKIEKINKADKAAYNELPGINDSNLNLTKSRISGIHGRVIKAYFGFYAVGESGRTVHPTNFTGIILLMKANSIDSMSMNQTIIIRPQEMCRLNRYNCQIDTYMNYIDITNELKNIDPNGYYYVSFINAGLAAQTSWGLFIVYEDKSLPIREVKVVKKAEVLEGGNTKDIDFGKSYSTGNNLEIAGMVIGGGHYGWNRATSITGDKFYAKKDDNSLQQLYWQGFNGKEIFMGRRNNDFFTGIYNNSGNTSSEEPQHSGGELDVFDETLTTTFFEGHSISGYRIEKTGTDRLYLGVFGLAKALSSNNLNDLK